jgi:acetylornithine deacetylase/succinyl-diaminopimelate desuccinylase-like protein
VIFLATGSEESGSELGTQWILRQHPELFERFWVVLTEGGVAEPIDRQTVKYWGIEFGQKRFVNVWLCSDSREQLETIKEETEQLNYAEFELRLDTTIATFFDAYAPTRENEAYRQVLTKPQEAVADISVFRAVPRYLRAMVRDETYAFPVEEDSEGGYRLRLVVHLLPDSDFDRVLARLLPAWSTHGVAISVETPLKKDLSSPLDHPAYRAQKAVLKSTGREATVGPYFLVWSMTDSRFFRDAGIPSYGFSPFIIFSTDTTHHDKADEVIGLPGYVEGVELYGSLLRRLAG